MNIKRKLRNSPLLVALTRKGDIEILKTAEKPSELVADLEKAKSNVKDYSHVAIARGLCLLTTPAETRKKAKPGKEKTAEETQPPVKTSSAPNPPAGETQENQDGETQ